MRSKIIRRITIALISIFCIVGLTACVKKDDNSAKESYELETPYINLIGLKESGIKVSWKKVDGAVNYRVFRKNDQSEWEIVGDSTDNSFVDENVEPGKTYSYTVRCIDSEGNNYLSDYDNVGKTVDNNMADKPKLSSVKQNNDGIQVKWNKVDGIENYVIYRKGKDSDWKKLDTVNDTKYVDKDVKSGKTYYYTVRCANEDYTIYLSGYDNKGLSTEYIYLDTPVISNVKNEKKGVKITWEKVEGAKKYRVFKKGKDDKWEKVLDTKSTECVDEGVSDGNNYTYTVRCLSEDGEFYMSGYDKNGASITYLK